MKKTILKFEAQDKINDFFKKDFFENSSALHAALFFEPFKELWHFRIEP